MWLRGQGKGWITAEYSMLPRATHTRTRRETSKPSGRTQEIQRLIGRSLRAVTNLPAMGERQITLDCDVLQADGGTRTAAITGAWVALHDCLKWMRGRSMIKDMPLKEHVAAVSCGIYQGVPVLDLDYAEDSAAHTDANFVITGIGRAGRGAGHRRGRGVFRSRTDHLARPCQRRRRSSGEPAEAGDRLDEPQARRPDRHRDPQRGQVARDARIARALRDRGGFGWRTRACRTGRDRRGFQFQRADQGAGSGPGRRTAGSGRRFPASVSRLSAVRRASFPRAGPAKARISPPPWRGSSTRRAYSGSPSRRAHFVSALAVAWPDGETATVEGKVFGELTFPTRGQTRLRLRPVLHAGRPFTDLRRDDVRGKARHPGGWLASPVAPGAGVPDAGAQRA